MKNLRDIKVKLGDKVYFEYGYIISIDDWARAYSNYEDLEADNNKIIKIERSSQYETIYEAPKQILDKEEKEYLENVIRPFKDRVLGIVKHSCFWNQNEYIQIMIKGDSNINLPFFNAGSMYKGMETEKQYTIKELGLF